MNIVLDNDVQIFLKKSQDLLYKNEAQNSLIVGLASNILRGTLVPKLAPLFLRIEDAGRTVAVAMQTPPMNLLLSEARDEDLNEFAIYLNNVGAKFPGVVGPSLVAEKFADLWQDLTGKTYSFGMGQKIYKLEKVLMPAIHGELRATIASDRDLLGEWLFGFANESLPLIERKPLEDWIAHAERSIANGTSYMFLIDGDPVSTVSATRPTENGISINGVYTPKHLRKNGNASQAVALLSQRMLDEGRKFCVLYTDLANPTSNKIYQKIGYQEVADSKFFIFN